MIHSLTRLRHKSLLVIRRLNKIGLAYVIEKDSRTVILPARVKEIRNLINVSHRSFYFECDIPLVVIVI